MISLFKYTNRCTITLFSECYLRQMLTCLLYMRVVKYFVSEISQQHNNLQV